VISAVASSSGNSAAPRRDPERPSGDRSRGKKNLVAEAQALGYQYAADAEGVAALTGPKVLAWCRRTPTSASCSPTTTAGTTRTTSRGDAGREGARDPGQDPDGFFLAIDVDEIDVGGHASHAGLVISPPTWLNRIVKTIEAYRATDPNLLVVVTGRPRDRRMDDRGAKSNSTGVLGYPIPSAGATARSASRGRT